MPTYFVSKILPGTLRVGRITLIPVNLAVENLYRVEPFWGNNTQIEPPGTVFAAARNRERLIPLLVNVVLFGPCGPLFQAEIVGRDAEGDTNLSFIVPERRLVQVHSLPDLFLIRQWLTAAVESVTIRYRVSGQPNSEILASVARRNGYFARHQPLGSDAFEMFEGGKVIEPHFDGVAS
jgi:hypothetical protein